jgi:hypothetical protein
VLPVCLNVAFAKGTPGLWQAEQLDPKCRAGGLWHDAQLAPAACLYGVFANGIDGLWQLAQSSPKCFVGGVWHATQSLPLGWTKTNAVPGLWQFEHSPRFSWGG